MSKLSTWLRSVGLRKPVWARKGFFPPGYGEEEKATFIEATACTMTDQRRILALIYGVKHIERWRIPGDVVECGVWKGGSMMVAARTLLNLGSTARSLYLFDTFEGMVAPTEKDIDLYGVKAREQFERSRFESGQGSDWCYSPLEEVRRNVASVGYPGERIHFVAGKVEDTLPDAAPEQIALLRLDTDWYESTLHELEHLYPRLTAGGIIIVDDYFWFSGAQAAVDEYLEKNSIPLFLNPIDNGAVIGVKPNG
jgi:O-methyltransferase